MDDPLPIKIGLAALIADKPHRCPDCYRSRTTRLWPLTRRSGTRWVVRWCRCCNLIWGGRRGE